MGCCDGVGFNFMCMCFCLLHFELQRVTIVGGGGGREVCSGLLMPALSLPLAVCVCAGQKCSHQ